MRHRSGVMVAAAMLAGCAADAPASFELELGGLPALVAVKADAGAWQALAPYAILPRSTSYQIPFADTLAVMVACSGDAGPELHELRTTRDELDQALGEWQRPSCLEPPAKSTISGHLYASTVPMQIAMSARFVGASTFTTADVDFAFPVEAQVLDLAVWNDTHVALRHGLDLREPLTLPLIYLDREATLITSKLEYDPLPPDMTVVGRVGIRTPNGLSIAWDTPAASPRVVPYGVLEANDEEWISVEGQAGVGFQRFTGVIGPAFPDHVGFLPPLEGLAVIGTAVTWRPFIDQFTAERLACTDDRPGAPGTYRYDVMQTVGWAMTHGNGRIELDLDAPRLPGFAQQIGDCTLEVERRFSGNQVAASGVRSL